MRVGAPMEFLLVLFVCLVPVVIVAAVAAVVVWLTRRQAPGATQGSSALEILKERYARGELTLEQYEEMRRTLEE